MIQKISNSESYKLAIMYVYFIIYIFAYICLGGYLVYETSKLLDDEYDKLYIWISYFMQPCGLFHPIAIGILNFRLRIIFSIYFLGAIVFWILVSHLFYKDKKQFLKHISYAIVTFAIIILFTCQIFFSVQFGACVRNAFEIKTNCVPISLDLDCTIKRNNAQAAYFFTGIIGATYISVMKDYEIIKEYNVACDYKIKHYLYFSTTFGSILSISTLMYLLITYVIHPCIKKLWNDVKKTHDVDIGQSPISLV